MTPREAPIAVRHYLPGGREDGGGIGRLVGHLVDAATLDGERHDVCDTRGPRWTVPGSLLHLAGAARHVTMEHSSAPDRVHHIHIAGRGSTARKLLLTAAARGSGARHCLHLHDYDYACDFVRRPSWVRARIQTMFRSCDGVIVLGERDRDTVRDLIGVPADRIEVIHNCVPDPGERATPPVADEPLILFLGTLGERKGVPELLRALATAEMRALRWRAVLAGDGPVQKYRDIAGATGLADRVTMPGWLTRTQVRALCQSADLLVLPSHGEGLAMAVLDGLASGLPVVTTRVGAHEEVITDGVTGVFVPPGDVDALAGAMGKLIRNPGERNRLSVNGRAHYLASFGMAGYLRRLRTFYHASGGGRPPVISEV
ncbi:MAG: glycosyltransferase family 4 protein [Amaricoccus sp.]|uniref:glycosyltransferase family 4 protein n=1 Tax=Amaricoccus sp. TaxID=1872485 RepID=UPI003316371F